MNHSEENGVFSIQTFNMTKRFTKKKHRGILGFLRRERKKESERSEQSGVTVALDDVNIKIRSGELFGLLGPNGAGKTTLVKCLSTILIADKGTAVVNGFDIRARGGLRSPSFGEVAGAQEFIPFIVLGAILNSFVLTSLYGMGESIRREAYRGTLDYILSSPCNKAFILIGKALSESFSSTLFAISQLAISIFFFGLELTLGIIMPVIFIVMLLILGLYGIARARAWRCIAQCIKA